MTENGWPPKTSDREDLPGEARPGQPISADRLVWKTVPGASVTIQVQRGEPEWIMPAWVADWNAYIEPVRDADTASFTPTNSVDTSNHLGGTAVDIDWKSHPFHVRGTLNADQMHTLREMLDFYEGTMFWAGDWDDPVDEMHSQMDYDTYQNPHTQDFIARKIRPDGFSTFRRGDAPAVDHVAVLADAMGNRAGVDYAAKLPAVAQCLIECECTTVERIAMWCAQVGHESGGLFYMEEIASGDAYEGRPDLGNTQPGDGPRFKGRGPIQVTGRHNYTVLSQWAFDGGAVPTPTFFVDHPERLADDDYGFIGVAWYWTTQRPMNAAADAKDIVRATQYVNGGTNGLQDRTDRWNHCLAMGDTLLTLLNPGEDDWMSALTTDEQREMLNLLRVLAATRFPSRSMYATGPDADTAAGRGLNAHAFSWDDRIESSAKRGEQWAIDIVTQAAAGTLWGVNQGGVKPDPFLVAHARAVLQETKVTKTPAKKAPAKRAPK